MSRLGEIPADNLSYGVKATVYQTIYSRPEHNTGTHTKSQIRVKIVPVTIAGPDRARRTTKKRKGRGE
jgi:hypothetical protein